RPRLVDTVEGRALVEKLGLRRVQILRLAVAECPPPEPDQIVALVANREHDTSSHAVVEPSGLTLDGEAGRDDHLRFRPALDQVAIQSVPTIRRPTQPKNVDGPRVNPTP